MISVALYGPSGWKQAMLASVDRTREDGEPLSVTIVKAVAEQEGVDPTEIRPPEYESLYEVCNPEALERLFSYDEPGDVANGKVTFPFCGYEVCVTSAGNISVEEPTS